MVVGQLVYPRLSDRLIFDLIIMILACKILSIIYEIREHFKFHWSFLEYFQKKTTLMNC